MKLSNNDKMIIEVLRNNNLHYLIRPFKQMIELNKLGHIKIHRMTWKVIMRVFHDDRSTKKALENCLVTNFAVFGILPVRRKTSDRRLSKNRVQRYRKQKKELGYKQLSVLVSESDLERVKRFKLKNGMTYQEVFSYMINNMYPIR